MIKLLACIALVGCNQLHHKINVDLDPSDGDMGIEIIDCSQEADSEKCA